VIFEIVGISLILGGRGGTYRQYERTLSAGGTPGGLYSLTRLPRGTLAAGVASQTHSGCSGVEVTFWWI